MNNMEKKARVNWICRSREGPWSEGWWEAIQEHQNPRNQAYIKYARKSLNPLICHWTITLLPGTMLFVKKYLGYPPPRVPIW